LAPVIFLRGKKHKWHNYKLEVEVSVPMKTKLLLLINPDPRSGGGIRALRFIKGVKRKYSDIMLLYFIVPSYTKDSILTLHKYGKVVGFINFQEFKNRLPLFKKAISTEFIVKGMLDIKKWLNINYALARDAHIIYSQHEVTEYMRILKFLKENIKKPCGVMLQLPPYYKTKRLRNIEAAKKLFYKAIHGTKGIIYWANDFRVAQYCYKLNKNFLRKFDFKIAVSRAILEEMSNNIANIHVLDPGVTLDEEDIRILNSIKQNVFTKKRIVIFGGRPAPTKGIIEALYAWAKISKRLSNYKLIITGHISKKLLTLYKKVCMKLHVYDRVIFTGFVPRNKRFELVAQARAVLYPSHEDSFPFSVIESLYLGTPIVAYSIPALKIYYKDFKGIKLVPELQINSLANALMDIIENHEEPEIPVLPSWEEIIDKEIEILTKYI